MVMKYNLAASHLF